MIYDHQNKSFRRFLRRLTPDEMVQAALVQKCNYWHADMKKLNTKEDRRKDRIEKEQWGTWEDDKAQLYMDTHDIRQKRLLETASGLAKASRAEHDRETAESKQDQDALEGNFWQMPADGKRKAIAKAKTAITEKLMNQLVNHPGQSSTTWVPENRQETWSADVGPDQPTYPWLPDSQRSTMQMTGAPRGTPFLGAVAEIESSMGRAGWELKDMPGETIDQKWFHFVYHKPLRGYENHPFFTSNEASSSMNGGDPQSSL